MTLSYDFYKSILALNGNLSKEEFLDKCGVSGGYAKEVFSRIYDNIFSELIDLEEEYKLYYSREYDSFEAFLFRKMNIGYDDIVALMKFKESKDYIKIYRSGDSSSGDYGIGQFVFSETMHARVIELIT